MNALLTEIFKSNKINLHSISSRLKDKDSLLKKIEKKSKYKNINEITDIVGIRIITNYEEEIDTVAKIISDEFEIDNFHSIDKRIKDFDRFGYSSLHFVLKLNSKRARLIEYSQFKDYKFEVQIRSLLQHTWAEIEHDIGYKAKDVIPTELKRRFSRIAALLEIVDDEFNRLKQENNKYNSDIFKLKKTNSKSIELNKITLNWLYTKNPELNLFDEEIAKSMNSGLTKTTFIDSSDLEKLLYLGVEDTNQLLNLIIKEKNRVVEFCKQFNIIYKKNYPEIYKNKSKPRVQRGIGLFYLSYLYALDTQKEENFDKYLAKYHHYIKDDSLKKELQQAYENINLS